MALLGHTLLQVNCPHAKTLDLSWNDITANGISELGPAFKLGALHSVTTLDLSKCTLLKALPEDVGHLPELETINLEGCTGLSSISTAVANLVCLRTLNVKNCHLLEPATLAKKLGLADVVEVIGTTQSYHRRKSQETPSATPR